MPAKKTPKKTTAKMSPAKKPVTRKPKIVESSSVCGHCSHLPLKSGELVAILLCLVFSLSAVLMTSLMLIEDQQHQLEQYKELVIRR
ncbi:MAG: hypothetical protein ABIG32_01175 [Candidatus Uhrbacteria bacterium]|nr:hypothetical protein [Patescibacteria group bacterium]MBU1906662.1 hypothetical protein [Patescibacteria group bacterium]